jgi:catechol 2,3-dioxygenase-like lactoylglutathione lyase family enzyme
MEAAVHISLNVSNLEESVRFYRGLFGEPRKLVDDYAKFVTAEPVIHLALQPGLPAESGRMGPLSHLGIRVSSLDEVRRRRKELKERGLVSEEEKREACCYALQEKFWLADPDGNRWEIYTVLEDLEVAPSALPVSCCAR